MYIYICYEESHGALVVADSVESAIDYFITDNWITAETLIHVEQNDFSEWVPLDEHYGYDWEKFVRTYSRNEFNIVFSENFYIRKDELYTKKNKG